MNMTNLFAAFAFSLVVMPAVSFAQGGGLFGLEAYNPTQPNRVYVPQVSPASLAPPRNTSGTLTIAAEFTIRGEHRQDYERYLAERNNNIWQLNNRVNQLRDAYNQYRTPQTEQALVQTLNQLRDANAELENFKRTWNQPITAQFNSKSIEYKDQLLERSFRLGMQGKSITFGNNADGSKKVTLFHGKPNYSKSEDVSHLF